MSKAAAIVYEFDRGFKSLIQWTLDSKMVLCLSHFWGEIALLANVLMQIHSIRKFEEILKSRWFLPVFFFFFLNLHLNI